MKRFLIVAAASLLIFSGQAEASIADLDKPIETQDMGTSKWANFRDKYILGRETENERHDREERQRRHREDRRRYHDDYRYTPPPPYYRDGRRYYPPPHPSQHQRDGRRYSPPNPPPTRHR